MLNSRNSSPVNTGMSVLERQRARSKNWQQEQSLQHQPVTYFGENEQFEGVILGMGSQYDQDLGELFMSRAMKPDPGFEYGWSDLSYGNRSEFEVSRCTPQTPSCPPPIAAAVEEVAAKGKEAALFSATGKESFKKRKNEKAQNLKEVAEENFQEKKMKGCAEEDSKTTDQNSNSKSTITTANNNNSKGTSADDGKENSKVFEVPKPDYIHVRARRGQATDSHSLAERARREKISERMKYLQDLVPGCNKITGKAGMLDEIINYVQSLQRQVEFLSMKLAAINPGPDFEPENYSSKEIGSEMVIPTHIQFNGLAQGVSCCDLETGSHPRDATLRRTLSAPVSIPDAFFESSCLNPIHPMAWDSGLQSLYSMEYQQERSTSLISQPFTGFIEPDHMKQEM